MSLLTNRECLLCDLRHSSDVADEGADTFHIEPMPAITTSFQRPSPSPSVLLARQRDSWSPPGGGGLAASSLGRRPAVARDPAPSCGVATPQSAAAGTRHPRRNSFTATVRPHPVSSTSDGCDVTKYTGCDVTGDAGSDVIRGGRRGSVSACSGGEHRDSRFAITLPFPEPQMSFVAVHTHTHTHTRLTALCPGLPG